MDFPRSDSPRRHKKKKKKHKHKQIKLDPSDAMEITSLVTPTLPDTPKAFPPQTELGSESSFSKAGSSHSNPAIIPPKHELMSSSSETKVNNSLFYLYFHFASFYILYRSVSL